MSTVSQTTQYVLTFADNFNSLSSSPSGTNTTWQSSYGWGGIYDRSLPQNHETEYYSDSSTGVNPFSVNNGILSITAAPAAPGTVPSGYGLTYTSGVLTTAQSFAQTYGYFEVRAELPSGSGFWPAFWLMPEQGTSELDVMEQFGANPTTIYNTAWTGSGSSATGSTSQVATAATAFHTYGVDWELDKITWYIDGVKVASAATPADMHTPMYMILNLAVGGAGQWAGSVDGTSSATYNIDYVRAYAKTSAAGVTFQQFLANQAALDTLGPIAIADSWSNVAAGLDALSADTNVLSISLTDASAPSMTITAAQAQNDTRALSILSAPWNYTITVSDTAANLAPLLAQLGTLKTEGITALESTNASLTVTAAQALNLESAGIKLAVPSGQHGIISDSGAALAALSTDQIAGLARIGITELTATSNVSFSVAETNALLGGGFTIAATAGHSVTEYSASGYDTRTFSGGTFNGTQYASCDIAYNAAKQHVSETLYDSGGTIVASEIWSYDTNGSLTELKVKGISGQKYTATDTLYTNGKAASETWTNGSALYQAETWNPGGSYDIINYTRGTFNGTQYASCDIAYNAAKQHVSETLYDSGGTIVASEIWSYDTNGSLTELKVKGISGQKYTATDTLYTNGKAASETWTNGSALYQAETWNPGGSVSDVRTYVAGTFQGVAYASYDNAYTGGSPNFRNLETFYDGSGNPLIAESFPSHGGAVTVTVFGPTTLTITGGSSENAIFDPAASGTVKLSASTAYTGKVAGFAAGDTLDLANLSYGAHMTLGYSVNGDGTGGTLSVSNGKQTANIALLGQYTASSFALSSDGHGGANVLIPQPAAMAALANPLQL